MARDKEKQRIAWKRWYDANRETHIERVRRREAVFNAEIGEWLRAEKASRGCEECGFSNPIALDFHHRDPSLKEFSIGDRLRAGYGRSRIENEVSKCSVLCKNCHAIHHHGLLV